MEVNVTKWRGDLGFDLEIQTARTFTGWYFPFPLNTPPRLLLFLLLHHPPPPQFTVTSVTKSSASDQIAELVFYLCDGQLAWPANHEHIYFFF